MNNKNKYSLDDLSEEYKLDIMNSALDIMLCAPGMTQEECVETALEYFLTHNKGDKDE